MKRLLITLVATAALASGCGFLPQGNGGPFPGHCDYRACP